MASLGRALGPVVAGVIQNMDVDDVVERIDVQRIAERIDIEKAVLQLDVNKILDKVDVDRLLQKVDLIQVAERAQIAAIVSRSTRGVMSPLVDGVRAQIIFLDQILQGHGWIRHDRLPYAPSYAGKEDKIKMPTGAQNMTVAVQQRAAGIVTRGMAFVIDQLIIYGILLVTMFVVDVVEKESIGGNTAQEIKGSNVFTWVRFSTWILLQFIYFISALSATGRTIGKTIMGLKVVNSEDGTQVVQTRRIVIRTLALPLSIASVVGVLLGLFRLDRREFHDIVSGTAEIYSWDARMARYREDTVEESQMLYTHSESAVRKNQTKASTNLHELFRRSSTQESLFKDDAPERP